MIRKLILMTFVLQLVFCGDGFATVRFAQITDLHLFEDPKRASEAKISASDFSLVIEKINQVSRTLKSESKEPLDFVILTGDLGTGKLLKIEPAEKGVKGIPFERDGKQFTLSKDLDKWNQALQSMANMIKASDVKEWLIIPGNNDLYEEQSDTIGFYKEFLEELQEMPQVKAAHLSIVDFRLDAVQRAQPQAQPGMYVLKDLVFVGWNNSFFKNNDSFKKFRGANHNVVSISKTTEYKSVEKLTDSLKASRAKYAYIFFHIPEIDDPYMIQLDPFTKGNVVSTRLSEAQDLSPLLTEGLYPYSAWTVPLKVRHLWEKVVTNKSFKTPIIKGLFAGHFHDHKKETYESTNWVKDTHYQSAILNKLYLAPPLSIKHQEKYPPQERARGGQIVTIDDHGNVSRDIFWLK